ncbi:MAG: GNAT family N-acetyltransferase [Acidobacteria bacterium]|nr:GNAT family N-acetyltransferase [Acidobacteriota bacterium]MBV9067289.1 GNAT family N-acetyltransferase [Acidobacteriota bacterium]MBV9186524.1 GNAT family N-acetyltransferase [Acidobacteriota bacterium]
MITIAPADHLTIVRELITEYANALGVDLSFQDLDHELSALDTFYELILLARDDDHVAGCVALRRIDDEICEMKRLYVRPAFRGMNLGRELAMRIIDAARNRGYKQMRLDTLPTMSAAIPLYQSLGFVEIEPYRFNPIPGTRFMELDLFTRRRGDAEGA